MSKINKVNDKLLGGLSSVWNDGRSFDNKALDGAYNVCKVPVILGGVVASGVLYAADKTADIIKLMTKYGVKKSDITFNSKKISKDKTVLVGDINHIMDLKKCETIECSSKDIEKNSELYGEKITSIKDKTGAPYKNRDKEEQVIINIEDMSEISGNLEIIAGDVNFTAMKKQQLEELKNLRVILGNIKLGSNNLSYLTSLKIVKGDIYSSMSNDREFIEKVNSLDEFTGEINPVKVR